MKKYLTFDHLPMANAQKDDIFHLIKKLSASEIRQFKKTSTLQDGQVSDYMQLFELIEGQSKYDEDLILKKLSKTQPQLSRIKNYLFEKIVNYLNQVYQDVDSVIQDSIKSYDTFMNIDLAEQAIKYLMDARKLAEQHSRNEYLYIINSKEIEYYRQQRSLNEKNIGKYKTGQAAVLSLLEQKHGIILETAGEISKIRHFIYIPPAETKKPKIKEPPGMDMDASLQYNYFLYLRYHYYTNGDLFNSILVSANIIEHVLEKKMNPNLFFMNLGVLFDELKAMDRTKDFVFFERKASNFFNAFSEIQKVHFKSEYNFCLFKCRYYAAVIKKDETALNKIVADHSGIFQGQPKISYQTLFYSLCKAHLLLLNGDPKSAIRELAVFREAEINIEPQLLYEAGLMEIACRILTKDAETLIESQLRSLTKQLVKIEGDTDHERAILALLNKFNNGQDEKVKKGLDELMKSSKEKANLRKNKFYHFKSLLFLDSLIYKKDYRSSFFGTAN